MKPNIVLSQAVFSDGTLDYTGQQRITQAFQIAQSNHQPLYILGGKGYYCETSFDEGTVMLEYLIKNFDTTHTSIKIFPGLTSSATQLIALKEFCIEENIHQITIITDIYHRTYLSYMVEKIFGSKFTISFQEVVLRISGKFHSVLTSAFIDQLQLMKKDRAQFTPGDHTSILMFQRNFENSFKEKNISD